MSADVLRRAAAVLREHAEAATDGSWVEEYSGETGPIVLAGDSHHAREWLARTQLLGAVWDAKYIALMHPPVGVALAAWLDAHGDLWDRWPKTLADTGNDPSPAALAVARAILREVSDAS